MKGNAEDAVREGAHALFYPHGLGHMMGLDVHDMENLGELWVGYNGQPKSTQFGRKSQRLAIPLEPGLYIPWSRHRTLFPTDRSLEGPEEVHRLYQLR